MISSLTGKVLDVEPSSVVIAVAGVGFSVSITPRHALKLVSGNEVTLETKLVVREDDLSLFGFESKQERELFELLCTVNGIGPKLAMTVLAGIEAEDIRKAVNSQNEAAFRAIAGVGPKTAKLIIISLAGKVGFATNSNTNSNVLGALIQLGTAEAEARKILEGLPKELSDAELLKQALAALGSQRLSR